MASQGALSQQAWFEQLLSAARDTQTLSECREQGSSGPGPAATSSIVPSVPSHGAPAPATAAQEPSPGQHSEISPPSTETSEQDFKIAKKYQLVYRPGKKLEKV